MNKTKIYLACPWARKDLAAEGKLTLEAAGFVVTSRWITDHADKPADQSGLDFDATMLKTEAMHDVEDIYNCDIMVLLNTQKRGEETSGKAVETGIAMAWLKPVIVVGERTNVFHYLDMPLLETIEEAISTIKGWEARESLIVQPSGIIPV